MRKLSHHLLFFSCLFVLPFFFCKKQVDYAGLVAHDHLPQLSLRASASKVALYQANSRMNAIRFDWGYLQGTPADAIYYVLEFSLKEYQFLNPVEIPVGSSTAAGFTVEEFNELIQRLIPPGDSDDIIARVKYMRQVAYNQKITSGDEIYYSDPILVQVTTYRHIVEYVSPNFLCLPGNYQNWDPLLAPRLVSQPGAKEYEGYVYFPIDYPQFLMLRGNQWYDVTFGHIGSDMFGVKGTPLSIFGGKGYYLIRASTNSNTWSYTKIKTMNITGSAVLGAGSVDVEMLPSGSNHCIWTVNVNLAEGEFMFRANSDNKITMGNAWPALDHTPDYNADGIRIAKPGNYTIELDLSLPGNYYYHLHLNRL